MSLRVADLEVTTIEVLEASISPDWVRAGYTSTVRATLRNPRVRDSLTVRITHGGTRVATREVVVPSQTTAEYTFEVTFGTPRSGAVELNGVTAGELSVVGEDGEPTAAAAAGVDERSGLGIFVGLFALLAGGLTARTLLRG